jgi:hypothetical protein
VQDRLDRHAKFGAIDESLGFPPFPARYMASRAPAAAGALAATTPPTTSPVSGGQGAERVPFFVQTTRSLRKERYYARDLELIWIPAPVRKAG